MPLIAAPECPNLVTVLPCRDGVEIRGSELYEYGYNGKWFGLLPSPCQQWSKSMLSCLSSTVYQPLPCGEFVWLHAIGEPYPNRLDPECRDIYFAAFQVVPGDVNLDGVADAFDLEMFRSSFLSLQWDWNRDAQVNMIDLYDLHNAIVLRVGCQ